MNVALLAFTVYTTAFGLHLIAWRIHRPQRPVSALLALFFGTLIAALTVIVLSPNDSFFALDDPWQYFHIALFHTAGSLAYIVLYSALIDDSPTLTIIAYVAASANGRTREELRSLIRNDEIIAGRCEALLAGGIIRSPEGKPDLFLLTERGRRWAILFRFFRQLYRLPKGG